MAKLTIKWRIIWKPEHKVIREGFKSYREAMKYLLNYFHFQKVKDHHRSDYQILKITEETFPVGAQAVIDKCWDP